MTNFKLRWWAAVVLAGGLGSVATGEIFRPEAVSGAVWGGLAGAVIGNNSGDLGHEAWRGAAIGTVAGGVLGHVIGEGREVGAWRGTQVPRPGRSGFYRGHDWARDRYDRRGHFSRNYRGEALGRDARVQGALWGGLAGAIIGHNDGRHGWEGAAYGTGAGLILGSIWDRAERRAAERESVRAVEARQPAATTPATVIINNYYAAPAPAAGGANALFGR